MCRAGQAVIATWLDAKAAYQVYDNTLTYQAPDPQGGIVAIDLTQREGLLANVLATQPLFMSGGIRANIDAAGADVSAAVSNQQTTELDVGSWDNSALMYAV